MTEHSSTARGGGLFYFKLINKTSWQEHFVGKYRVLCIIPGSALKLVRVHDKNNNSCIMFIIFASPKPPAPMAERSEV